MTLRPLRPEDGPALERLARSCDPEDLRLRFFQVIGEGHRKLLDTLTQLDPKKAEAFIAFEPQGLTPLAVVRLHDDPMRKTGEFAVLVRSDSHGRGVGHALMTFIIQRARERGYETVKGEILPENVRMLSLARSLGFSLHPTADGVVEACFDLAAPRG